MLLWKRAGRSKEFLDVITFHILRNGIYIGDNLIISEESKEFPLGTNEIEQLIRVNFL
jgi:hypothetical protein